MKPESKRDARRRREWTLIVAASVLWLGAWIWIRSAFTIWVIMVGVYGLILAMTILSPRTSPRSSAFDAWQERFIRTSGWVVLSGFLTLAYIVVASIVFAIIALLLGRL
jgi:hypothetical protein